MSSLKELIKKSVPPTQKSDLQRTGQSSVTPSKAKRGDSETRDKKHILVLDDDPTFGELMMRYKNKYEVEIECFENVHQFVQRLSEEKFDVVILDYFLEGYVGTQLASLIQGTPVIMVSNKTNWQENDSTQMPANSRFIHKKAGPDKILSSALALASR